MDPEHQVVAEAAVPAPVAASVAPMSGPARPVPLPAAGARFRREVAGGEVARPDFPVADPLDRVRRDGHVLDASIRRRASTDLPTPVLPTVVRRRSIGLPDGREIKTEELKRKELRRLATSFPSVQQQIADAITAGEYLKTRRRPRHQLSEGESEEEDIVRDADERSFFRSLREGEEPEVTGLLPPDGHDPTITASAHVNSGSRAVTKSKYISASHSMYSSGAWAAAHGSGRVAQVTRPSGEFHDLTQAKTADDLGLGDTARNAASSSQEVLFGEPVPPHYVKAVWEAKKLRVGEYQESGGASSGAGGSAQFRTRTKVKETPTPVRMRKVYDRDEQSSALVERAREYWAAETQRAADEINERNADDEEFEPISADDVAESLVDDHGVQSPYDGIDYFENEGFYDAYIQEIDDGISAYLDA